MKPWIKRTAIGLGCLVTALIIGGAIFEAIARQQAAQKYPKLDPEVLKNMNMSEEQGRKLQATWRELQNDRTT